MFFLEIVLYFKRNIYLFIWVCVKFRARLKGVGSLRDQIQAIRFGVKHLFLLAESSHCSWKWLSI